MRLLLDTHIFLWAVADDPRLLASTRHALADPDNDVFVSAATAWEISIKVAAGKLVFPVERYAEAVISSGYEPLDVTSRHAIDAGLLPPHHADPFDRMLIAQANAEDMTLVSVDGNFGKYDVRLLS